MMHLWRHRSKTKQNKTRVLSLLERVVRKRIIITSGGLKSGQTDTLALSIYQWILKYILRALKYKYLMHSSICICVVLKKWQPQFWQSHTYGIIVMIIRLYLTDLKSIQCGKGHVGSMGWTTQSWWRSNRCHTIDVNRENLLTVTQAQMLLNHKKRK